MTERDFFLQMIKACRAQMSALDFTLNALEDQMAEEDEAAGPSRPVDWKVDCQNPDCGYPLTVVNNITTMGVEGERYLCPNCGLSTDTPPESE